MIWQICPDQQQNNFSEFTFSARAQTTHNLFTNAISTTSWADTTITGKVRDAQNNPIQGATVTALSTQKSTLTDSAGTFTISVPSTNDTLEISYVGYANLQVPINNQQQLSITMTASKKDLDEVVVIGYGSQKRENLTGSVATVSVNKITDIPVTRLSNALAGRAPGVRVTNTSGFAGASSAIRIRGSIGEPLYVIDGIIKSKAAFDALDPNEVDNMSILKDAATASIYGSRAGNGVVVVTTKKGSAKQKPQISFQSSYTTSSPTQTLLSDLSSATDELTYQNRVAYFNAEQAGRLNTYVPPNGQAEYDYFKDKSYNVNDWIWRNPSTQKYLLSVNGGNDRITYYSMVGYTGETGSYLNLDYNKFNMRTNVSAKISDAIKLDLNVAGAQQNENRFYWPFTGDDDFNVGDFYRVTFNWSKVYPFYLEKDGRVADHITEYPVQTPLGTFQSWSVIDQAVGDRYIKTRRRQLNSILTLDVDLKGITKGLSTKFMANYEANDYMRKWYMTFQKNYVFVPADPTKNRFEPGPPDPNRVNIFNFSQNAPFLQYNMNTGWQYQLDWFLTYTRKFGKHGIDALVVWEQAENQSYSATAKGSSSIPSVPIDQIFAFSNDELNRYGTAGESIGARQSWIGRLNYNFASRYIAEFSFRYDGNTLFGPGKQWGFFPSGSLAWRISEEKFFKDNISWIDNLKLRASYGTTGDDLDVNGNPIPIFAYKFRYVNTTGYMFGDQLYTSIGPGPTPNPDITWATTENTNVGLDFAVLNNRLSGKLDYFVNRKKNILGSRTVTLPDNYGQTLAPENYAARSFRGAELSLEWNSTALGKQINYSIYGNAAYAKDRWDILDEGPEYLPGGARNFQSSIGQAVNRHFGLKSFGLIRTQKELDELLAKNFTQFGRKPYLGAILYEDIRGDAFKPGADGKVDANDIQLLSNNGAPRITFGAGFAISWKGLSLDAHVQGVSAYDRMISNLEGGGVRQHGGVFRVYYPIWADDVWDPENPNAKYPRPVGQSGWQEAGATASSFWIRNGAYVRLRNLNLSYNLPQKWMSPFRITNCNIFFNGTNLLTFSDMKEFQDPEQDVYDSYPIMKTLTLGLNLTF